MPAIEAHFHRGLRPIRHLREHQVMMSRALARGRGNHFRACVAAGWDRAIGLSRSKPARPAGAGRAPRLRDVTAPRDYIAAAALLLTPLVDVLGGPLPPLPRRNRTGCDHEGRFAFPE
jgi:hypothetical protein